jgi:SAM-dependent methyltransferase
MQQSEEPAESAPPDLFHVEQDEEYRRLLREEEAHRDGRSETLLSKAPKEWLRRYHNERLAGDPNREWFETIGDFGDFERGCVLGAGPGRIEAHLLQRHERLHLTVYDIAAEALGRIQARLEKEFGGRIATRQEDLNFVTLPENSFDLIVSEACVHHLVNLEHVAFQVNRALTRDGYFFLRDTVGESYLQFSPEKKRLYAALLRATGSEEPILDWPDREHWAYSPFESARSGETLEVFRQYLSEIQLRTCNALLRMNLVPRHSPRGQSRALHHRVLRRTRRIARGALGRLFIRSVGAERYLSRARARTELLLQLDGILSDSGHFKPGMAFAIYRKRGHAGG